MRCANEGDEDTMNPVFPRLYVNRTGKGRPKASPRNKMAPYEHSSVPPRDRCSSGSASMLPCPTNNCSCLVLSMSSSHGCGHKSRKFTSFCYSFTPELSRSFSSGRTDELNTLIANHERKSLNATDCQSSNPSGSNDQINLFRHGNLANPKNLTSMELAGDDDFTLSQSGIVLQFIDSQLTRDPENITCLNLRSSMQLQSACPKQEKRICSGDLKSRQFENQSKQNAVVSQTSQNRVQISASVPSVKNSDPSKRTRLPINPQNSFVFFTNVVLRKGFLALEDETVQGHSHTSAGADKESAFILRSDSSSSPSFGDYLPQPTGHENGIKCQENKKYGTPQVGVADRHYHVFDSSMVDSKHASNLSPDDIVGIIGEKAFWKTRSAMVVQQRVFAVQVFELHRLIKVQRLFARLPHLLLGKASSDLPSAKKLQRAHPSIGKDKVAVLYAIENLTGKGIVTEQANYGSYSKSTTPVLTANDGKHSWIFPYPGNQWLVPVMSSAEGLIYKPFPALPASTAVFEAPVCGSLGLSSHSLWCSSISSTMVGDAHRVCQASGLSDNGKGDALPLFPMEPMAQAPNQMAQAGDRSQVIKVIPHNSVSATKSAVQIFQSLQEERKQYA